MVEMVGPLVGMQKQERYRGGKMEFYQIKGEQKEEKEEKFLPLGHFYFLGDKWDVYETSEVKHLTNGIWTISDATKNSQCVLALLTFTYNKASTSSSRAYSCITVGSENKGEFGILQKTPKGAENTFIFGGDTLKELDISKLVDN
eukprot:Phypoly_transcript_15407.p1 GENE.Phypoly_transcript_15407~~Phypoly_transcript_15407.p1  ORF type:complete len:145 (+),score=28.94 Phypoly_transcript_15407:477-911(+)